jgi:hypothetical protein
MKIFHVHACMQLSKLMFFFIFSVSFDLADLDIHAWFRMNVNIERWEDISPADVSVDNIFGSVRCVFYLI